MDVNDNAPEMPLKADYAISEDAIEVCLKKSYQLLLITTILVENGQLILLKYKI